MAQIVVSQNEIYLYGWNQKLDSSMDQEGREKINTKSLRSSTKNAYIHPWANFHILSHIFHPFTREMMTFM